MGPLLKWVVQFAAMKEKMRSAVKKLRNTVIATSTASLYYNMYLTTNVYFGCGVMYLMPKQEEILKKIYKPVLLQKIGLSIKFPRKIVYARKSALGIGLIAPSTIIDTLVLKLYLGYKRMEDEVSKIIRIIEENAKSQYGYATYILKVQRKYKPK